MSYITTGLVLKSLEDLKQRQSGFDILPQSARKDVLYFEILFVEDYNEFDRDIYRDARAGHLMDLFRS